MDPHVADIKKHVRLYITVFVSLMVLTIVTVAVAYLHLNIMQAVIVAMFIAIIKGSLVAAYFMHLISEKKLIYLVLILTGFMTVAMMILINAGFASKLGG
jgi:cytochrome c oxidase subunit 4